MLISQFYSPYQNTYICAINQIFMNAFYDICMDGNLSDNNLQLRNLGKQKITAIVGRPGRNDFYGHTPSTSTRFYADVTANDYDEQFVWKIKKWSPVYEIDNLLEHHYNRYSSLLPNDPDKFIKHVRYVVLPRLKTMANSEVHIDITEKWLKSKEVSAQNQNGGQTVNNNTISFGAIHAPIQFQQNSSHSNLTQHNTLKSDDLDAVFRLLSQDLKKVDEKIRKDFELEMDYAVTALGKGRDIRPQLSTIGSLVGDVGIGTFTNLVASPIYELIKPFFGM